MSKSSELDQTVKRYIIDGIAWDGYDGLPEPKDIGEKIQFLKDCFNSEYGWAIPRMGEQKAIHEWLQGLPSAVHIAFYNSDILKLAILWGSLPENATEKQEDKILDNYWNFMANKIGQLFHGYHVPKDVPEKQY